MKKMIYFTSYFIGLTLVLGQSLSSAEAKEKGSKHSTDESPITYRRSEHEAGESKHRYGFGFSTYAMPVPGTKLSSLNTPALSGSMHLDKLNMVQGFFSIPGTSPAFNIAGSIFFKHTCYETSGAGLHFGGGIGAADANEGANAHLELSFSAVAGVHFTVPGTQNLLVYLDGGPTFYLVNTDPSHSSFILSPLSPALGASVLYHY